MIEEFDFETYLFISQKELKIYLFDTKNHKNLYEKKLINKNHNQIFDYNILNSFLDDNIFKIEKLIGGFLKTISLVINDFEITNIYLGIKKKNYEKNLDKKNLESILADAHDLFKENNNNKRIMHIIINKYLVNNNYETKFDESKNVDSFSLEVQFITISKNLVSEINKILEKYNIKSNKWFDENYVKNFFKNNHLNISEMVYRIQMGINDKEVKIIPKNYKRVGFFERFFQLFS